LRSIDVALIPGQMIHIPAYWWYSVKFVKSNTSVCVFKYKTYMSALSISNHLIMRMLQRQNTKHVIAKQMRWSTPSLPNAPNESSDTVEVEHKDIKIDIVNDDVKVFDATQAQVHPNDNVKDIINQVNSVV
jgi:hypothetical protein